MPFVVRPMEEEDLLQLQEIERDAFPNLFPPTPFRRELKSQTSLYLVACLREGEDAAVTGPMAEDSSSGRSRPLMGRLLDGARDLWSLRSSAWQPGQELLAGFIGVWYVVEQAHVVSVGVRSHYRGSGIGELLLIKAMEHAMACRAKEVTLEVRVSNYVAKNLYRKYGFIERGIRKGYYSDNREDAVIMTTDPIGVDSYSTEFHVLVRAHEDRWGPTECPLK